MGTTSTPYYYVKNLQGDIVAIARGGDGAILARYAYDAWGNILSITDNGGNDVSANTKNIGNINPLRYRGYYYDSETGLYYLKSRFYDPTTGRFVNADSQLSASEDSVQGTNLYTYCFNNPVNMSDSSGNWPKFLRNLVATVATVVGTFTASRSVVWVAAEIAMDKANANPTEKKLAHKNYVAAIKVQQSRRIAEDYQKEIYGGVDRDNTVENAYKHAMWNAVMTDKIGEEKAKLFADAHEDVNWNEPLSMNMDFHNNALGRKIAIEYAGQGYDVFSQKILEAIANGEAEVLIWD